MLFAVLNIAPCYENQTREKSSIQLDLDSLNKWAER